MGGATGEEECSFHRYGEGWEGNEGKENIQ